MFTFVCVTGCKYGRGDGFVNGECDPATNQKTITLVLKRGNPQKCAPTEEVVKKCKGNFAASGR